MRWERALPNQGLSQALGFCLVPWSEGKDVGVLSFSPSLSFLEKKSLGVKWHLRRLPVPRSRAAISPVVGPRIIRGAHLPKAGEGANVEGSQVLWVCPLSCTSEHHFNRSQCLGGRVEGQWESRGCGCQEGRLP